MDDNGERGEKVVFFLYGIRHNATKSLSPTLLVISKSPFYPSCKCEWDTRKGKRASIRASGCTGSSFFSFLIPERGKNNMGYNHTQYVQVSRGAYIIRAPWLRMRRLNAQPKKEEMGPPPLNSIRDMQGSSRAFHVLANKCKGPPRERGERSTR